MFKTNILSNNSDDNNDSLPDFSNQDEQDADNDKEKSFDDLELKAEQEDGDEEKENKNKEEKTENKIKVSQSKLALIKKLLANVKENNERINTLLFGSISPEDEEKISIGQISDEDFDDAGFGPKQDADGEGRIIEGVFDGENMIGPDGKQYSVPSNYASKSKLVEGDILKLTITSSGTFIYKQIGPIERSRMVGNLNQDANGNFSVEIDGKEWQVLTASVTYYKGQAEDEVVILVPKTGDSKWAAVENIVRKTG